MSEEEILRRVINGAIRCGVYVPRAAAQMLRDARFNDIKRRVDEIEKTLAARVATEGK